MPGIAPVFPLQFRKYDCIPRDGSLLKKERRPLVRKGFLIGLIASGVALYSACILCPPAFFAFRSWLLAPADCPSQCKGDLFLKWGPSRWNQPEAIPNCQPTDLRLELYKSTVKRGEPYPLWYRATLRNNSCFTISSVLANELRDGFDFKIWNSKGVEVAKRRHPWNDLIPYNYDRKAYDAMKRDPTFKSSTSLTMLPTIEQFRIQLKPGQSVANLPSVFLPSLNWLQTDLYGGPPDDFSIQSPSMRRAIEERIRGRKFSEPPPGYAVVDGYVFHQPGKYRVQAEIRSDFLQVESHPHFDWYRTLTPAVLRRLIDWFCTGTFGATLTPRGDSDIYYQLHAQSNVVEFDVAP